MISPADFISTHSPCHDGRAFLVSCPDLRTAWQTCERPDWMLWALRRINHTPERELRLFACACARRTLPRFEELYPDDERPRRAIETAERYANGQATAEEMRLARSDAADATSATYAAAATSATSATSAAAAAATSASATDAATYAYAYAAAAADAAAARTRERKACADLLRQFVTLPDNVFA